MHLLRFRRGRPVLGCEYWRTTAAEAAAGADEVSAAESAEAVRLTSPKDRNRPVGTEWL